MMHRRGIFAVIVVVLAFLSNCAAPPAVESTPTRASTSTLPRVFTPAREETPTPTRISTSTLTATYTLPGVPPSPARKAIDSENAVGIVHLSHWPNGNGMAASLDFSPDGALLAAGFGDGSIRLWTIPDGELVRTLDGSPLIYEGTTNERGYPFMDIDFSPNGKILASASGNVRLWNVSNGYLLRILETGHVPMASSVSLSMDGSMIAARFSFSPYFIIWHAADGEMMYTIDSLTCPEDEEASGKSVAFSTVNYTLAVAGGSCSFLWRVGDPLVDFIGRGTRKYRFLEGGGGYIVFSQDGKTLASSGYDGSIHLSRVSDGTLLATLADHPSTSLDFSKNGQLLVSGGSDGAFRLWQVDKHLLLLTLKTDGSAVRDVKFSPDGTLIASGSEDGSIDIWGLFP